MKKEELIENSLRLLVSVIGIFIICIVLLTIKLKVDAAEPGALPYPTERFNEYVNPDDYSISDLQEFYNNRWGSNYPLDFSTPNTLVISRNEVFGAYGEMNVTTVYIPNSNSSYVFALPNNTLYESFDYTTQSITLTLTHYSVITFTRYRNQYSDPTLNSLDWSGSLSLFGINLYPATVNGSYDYLPNKVVFTQAVYTVGEFESGHAVAPSFDSDTIIDSGLHPNVLPSSPSYTTYNITTYQAPTIDTSSVENLLKSIWDVISYTGQYVISNVGGFFNNIWNNISLAFGYIGDLLSYLFNKVLNSIKQSVNNLFENFRDLFEPVLNSFANMINIFNTLYNLGLKDDKFDIPTLFGALFVPNQSDLALLVDTFVEFDYLQTASVSIKSLINGVFDVLNDDAVYSIHLQGFTFHGVSVPEQEISFDWYLPYKSTGDIFISAFLIVGYLYWLWTRISGIFHGAVPDSQGSSNITVDHSVSGVGGWFDY